jgi:hypothetical protein
MSLLQQNRMSAEGRFCFLLEDIGCIFNALHAPESFKIGMGLCLVSFLWNEGLVRGHQRISGLSRIC